MQGDPLHADVRRLIDAYVSHCGWPQAIEDAEQGLFWLERETGGHVGLQWRADERILHVYAPAGVVPPPREGPHRLADDDDQGEEGDETNDADADEDVAASDLDLGSDENGQWSIYVDEETRTVTLDLEIQVLGITVASFSDCMDAFLSSLDTWELVFGGRAAPPSHTAIGAEGMSHAAEMLRG